MISIPSNYNIVDLSLFHIQSDSALFQGTVLEDEYLMQAKSGQIRLGDFLEKIYKPYSDGDGFGKLSRSSGIATLAVPVLKKLVSNQFPHSACISVDINAFNANVNLSNTSAASPSFPMDIWTLNGRPRSFSVDSRPSGSDPNFMDPTNSTGSRTCFVRVAIFAFTARKERELSIKVGDEIAVISENKSGYVS